MPGQLDFFNAVRVNAVMQGVYDPRLNPQPLVWDRRIPSVPAADDEIMARFIGFPLMADLIADDAAAVTYTFGKFQFETTKIPNLKVGTSLNESLLRQMSRIQAGGATRDEVGLFSNWENRIISAVRYGVDLRREALLIAMLFDNLSYDRLGIKLSGATWGMYSDLKITVGTAWDTAGSATPVSDLFAAKLIGSARYSMIYDRVTMSTTAFRNMIATTEFQNKARLYLAPNVSYTNLTLTDIQGQLKIAQNVLGMTIELEDRRAFVQDTQGVTSQQPLWPIAGVVLSDSRMDGSMAAWDFANGQIMESVVAGLVPGQAPAIPSGYGPIAYPTLANTQLNPPGINYWAVQRGFPRKHMLAANAALTVGTFGDTIATTTPF